MTTALLCLLHSLTAAAVLRGALPATRAPPPLMSVGLDPGESQPSTAPLYAMMERLLRRAERSPPVRALASRWLTMAPAELAENALIIGRNVVGDFENGAELLDCAEQQTGASLSPRAYGALMRLGEAEERHAEVLALLGRMRAKGGEPSASMYLAAMQAAAELGDWGGVARLFSEYAGTDDSAEILELIGNPEVVAAFKAEITSETDSSQPTKLTPFDTDALRLALHAHCARGDLAMAKAVLVRARELGCALNQDSYKAIIGLALSRKSIEPVASLSLVDAALSLRDWAEPALLETQARVSKLSRAEKDLFTYSICGVGLLGLLIWLSLPAQPGAVGAAEHAHVFSNSLTGFDHLDAL
uniref:Uncharacterized protein n=1 Tax=Strombidinopsis acuminata TaxID=141414 RepID=A0A7S3W0U5_9SPIT|mmetsp:Transcript_14255/g.43777  ORF Transcript_14255/g.43777 Transcript_14255/m.43777 type:complete len:359 (-) Transcript_14255:579-1655(-)